ncbi:hypothetical protein ACFL5V_00125 [Fibrobacterota bacterium]
MKRSIYSAFFVLLISSAGRADDFQSASYGEFGAEYLKLARHAHSAGLANAVTAWQEDLAGLQFNPALLASNKAHLVKGTYTYLTLDRKYNSTEYASPAYGNLVWAISCLSFGVDDIEGRDEDGNLTENFNDNEINADFTLSGRVPGLFSYGVRLRYLFQKIGESWGDMAQGAGLDLGFYYRPWERVGVGASLLSLGSKMYWDNGHQDWVVPVFRMGVFGNLIDSILAVEVDIMKPWTQPLEASFGMQGTILKVLAARAGIGSAATFVNDKLDFLDPELFFGVGLRYNNFGIDYSAMKPWSPLGLGHKFTLLVKFPGVFR